MLEANHVAMATHIDEIISGAAIDTPSKAGA